MANYTVEKTTVTILCTNGMMGNYWFIVDVRDLTERQNQAIKLMQIDPHDTTYSEILQPEMRKIYDCISPPQDPDDTTFASNCLRKGWYGHDIIQSLPGERNTLVLVVYPKHCYLTPEQWASLFKRVEDQSG